MRTLTKYEIIIMLICLVLGIASLITQNSIFSLLAVLVFFFGLYKGREVDNDRLCDVQTSTREAFEEAMEITSLTGELPPKELASLIAEIKERKEKESRE